MDTGCITDGPPPCARNHQAVVLPDCSPLVLPPSQEVGSTWA